MHLIYYITVEITSPGDPSSNETKIQENEGKGNQNEDLYCGTTLWRHPMAQLSCDFGPIKGQKGAKRQKRSLKSQKDQIRKIIRRRFQRQRGRPAYYVADDMRTTEELGELNLGDSQDYITIGDMPSIQDSGGTKCAWDSLPIDAESAEKSWKLQRLVDFPLTQDYYSDFLRELSAEEKFRQNSQTESPILDISHQNPPQIPDSSQIDDDPMFFSEEPSQESIDEAYIADLFDYIDNAPWSVPSDYTHRTKRSGDQMNIQINPNGPPFDSTTESTTGDGYYLIWDAKSPFSNSHSNSTDQFFSPYFLNTFSDVCLNFKYFIHTNSDATIDNDIDGGLLVYLLPCEPSYKVPVLNLTGAALTNNTDRWVYATAPLPSNLHPYRAIFEGIRPNSTRRGENVSEVAYVALDDIVLSECGE